MKKLSTYFEPINSMDSFKTTLERLGSEINVIFNFIH